MPVKLSEVLMSDPPDFEVDMLTRLLDRLLDYCEGQLPPESGGMQLVGAIRDALEAIKAQQGDGVDGLDQLDVPDGDDVGLF